MSRVGSVVYAMRAAARNHLTIVVASDWARRGSMPTARWRCWRHFGSIDNLHSHGFAAHVSCN